MEVLEYRKHRGAKVSEKDVPIIAGELRRIAHDRAGWLEPGDVVAAARIQSSPLHRYFEWDNDAAAEKYRGEQARHLIQSIEVVVRKTPDSEPLITRCWVHINETIDDDAEGSGYMSLEAIIDDESAMRGVAERAAGQLMSWKRQYETYLKLGGFKKTVRPILRQLAAATR